MTMDLTLTAVLLGVVEGLTEFIPVSSTGHLILASEIFGYDADQWKVFNVVIQLGAILAVVVQYWRTFWAVGIGLLGVSFAFGLTVVTGAYALGPVSGGHFNPAVSVGLWAGGRFPASQLVPYVVAQVLGGIAGAAILYVIASGAADFSLAGGFASNGFA